MFDVFISHNNEDKRWIIALANNLKQCGLSVWLDLLEAKTGGSINGQWREALEKSSRGGLLLVTPQSLETDWLQEQYEAMRARQQEHSDFRFIPLFFGTTSKARWINSPMSVDFSHPEPAAYRAAFRKLLSALRKQRSDPVEVPSDLEIPKPHIPHLDEIASRPVTKGEEDCMGLVFETLGDNRPVMLLGPSDYDKTPIQKAILAEARQRYGAGNILHLVPHGNAEASKEEYFAYLCDQIARTKNLNRPSEFEYLLENLMARGKTIFLMMTRIEEGSAEGRRALSHALRNLSERYYDWLKLVLCGGEHLLELRYKEGSLSPLRKAEALVLPEPAVDDIRNWRGKETDRLTEEEASDLLRMTGGNMRLIQQSLKSRPPSNPLEMQALAGKLGQDAILRIRFLAYRESEDAERVASLLLREDLGHFVIWPIQALLRHLYWDGMLVERDGRFRWRSELVRQIGREVMGV